MLKIKIYSFSYKESIPSDDSEHGGGFVFDCRCLPNPGRGGKHPDETGLDKSVRDLLLADESVNEFQNLSFSLVRKAVNRYLERNFDSLMVSFGCTGGQHRSIYFASTLADELAKLDGVEVSVQHTSAAAKRLLSIE